MVRGRRQGLDKSLAKGAAPDGGAAASSRSAMPVFVDAEHHPLDSEAAGTTVRDSRHLRTKEMWRPAVGVLAGMVVLLLLLLAGFIFCRWRKRSKLMNKTVKDFSGFGDVEAQTKSQANPTTRRPSLAGIPPPPPPALPVEKPKPRHILDTAPPAKERLGTRPIFGAAPPSPHSNSSEGPKMERARGSTLLLAAGNPNPPTGAAPSPPGKSGLNPETKTKLTLAVKTKQNRVEDGTMSPMTAMSTEAPSSFRGVPPTKWEHEKVETVRTVRKDACCSSPSGKVSGVGGEDRAPHTKKLLRKTSSFERARGAIIGFDLDVPHGVLDSASGSLSVHGSRSGPRPAAPAKSVGNPPFTVERPHRNMSADSACGSVAVDAPRSGAHRNSVRNPPSSTIDPPQRNISADSACGSVAVDGPHDHTRSTFVRDNGKWDTPAGSRSSLHAPNGGGGDGSGGRTLRDAGVFESFASFNTRGDYTFDSGSGAGDSAFAGSAARAAPKASAVRVGGIPTLSLAGTNSNSNLNSTHASNETPARNTRHLPVSPIDSVFGLSNASGYRRRAHTTEDGNIIIPVGRKSDDLRVTLSHRRSRTDFPSPRGGGLDFRWDSAAGSAFREGGADNFCFGCQGTGIQYDSAAGSVFPPSTTVTPGTTPGTAGIPRCTSSGRFDGFSSTAGIPYGDNIGGDSARHLRGGVRCHCVRDHPDRGFGDERRTMKGGRQRSFSVSALPNEASLSHLFGKE